MLNEARNKNDRRDVINENISLLSLATTFPKPTDYMKFNIDLSVNSREQQQWLSN